MKNTLFLLLSLWCCVACESSADQEYSLTEVPLDTQNSGMPNLFVDAKGQATLTWIERSNDTLAQLKMAQLDKQSWSAAKLISQGSNWFVNWADFPAFASFPNADAEMAAHWLQKRAAGTYDYDIRVATSLDGGQQWSDDFILHRDSIAAEHGFVTLLPIGQDRVFATWLDGRNTKTGNMESNMDHGHGGGAMTLRTAEFDVQGNLYEEMELDTRICDCCQTDAVVNSQGPIVVYRDRSEREIRDISIVRKVRGIWSDPQTIGSDHWQINGCPVNGPAVAAQGNQVAVAWFTMAADTPKVQVVFSTDYGASFGVPIRVDAGNPLGRVDIVFDQKDQVLVSYLEDQEGGSEVRVVPVSKNGMVVGPAVVEIPIDGARKSGFPILEKLNQGYLLALTEVLAGKTQVRTYLIQ